MTQQEEYLEKAKTMIGTWIYDKMDEDVHLFVYDYEKSSCDDYDVELCCIAIDKGDELFYPSITEKNVWMSELKEYYRKLPDGKSVKMWEQIKKRYDEMFKAMKE